MARSGAPFSFHRPHKIRDLTHIGRADRESLQFSITLQQVEVPMPHYEFFCHDCQKFFDKILSLADYEEGAVQCPHCGSKKVEQRWSPFSAITSKKSA
jgi:putative FmdB family regulatory protein